MYIFSIILIINVIIVTVVSIILRKQRTKISISLITKLNKNFNTLFYKIEEKIRKES